MIEHATRIGETLDLLDRAATEAANAGRWDEAERLWMEMRGRAPNNRNALWGLGFSALQRGDARKAKTLLAAAQKAAPQDKVVPLTLAMACRDCGDGDGEAAAITAALAIDAYYLPALLAKATMLERQGHLDAPTAYGNALKVAHAPERWPQELRAQLEHAKSVVDKHRRDVFSALSNKITDIAGDMPDPQRERWREAASIMAQLSAPYHSQSNQLFVPRLSATPFYDVSSFPWAEAVQSKTAIIREELMRALQTRGESFVPYINKTEGAPVNQWGELNHSKRWSALHLWANGERVEENLSLCPETAKVLALADQAHIAGNCPNAMFSALAPHTHIPPHYGETNARLVAHLPLVVPERCGGIRVGFQQREWQVGELLIFDDSIEHEAWNDSDELRVVLIFDVWNPELTTKDREIVNALTIAAADFRA
ncbi:MAG: aspartyl/asparaginyl beta-hydroxylase domain-containing protein [Vitreimonas sp.]